MINKNLKILFISLSLIITGCASNKKKYIERLPDIPSNWSSIYEGLENSNGWIDSFEAQRLYMLINEALENNKDLGIAYENIKIARARAGASLAPLLPTVSVGAAKSQISTTYQDSAGEI